MTIAEEIKQSFKEGNALNKLIYINVGIFLAVQIVRIVLFLSNSYDKFPDFIAWLAVPSNLHTLGTRPWTLVTYMFLHVDFIHILFNLLWFFWFGRIFLSDFGEKKLLGIYLIGGLTGGLLYVALYNLFPVFDSVKDNSVALGASASIMAVVIASSFYIPNRRLNLVFLGPVKIVYVGIVMFILSSLVDFASNSGGKIAHIGGAFVGFFFAYYYRRGRDITRGFDHFMDRLISFFKRDRSRKNMKVTYKKSSDDFEYNRQKKEEQKEIDRILEKISKGGYDSLTAEEKEKLFKMSNRK